MEPLVQQLLKSCFAVQFHDLKPPPQKLLDARLFLRARGFDTKAYAEAARDAWEREVTAREGKVVRISTHQVRFGDNIKTNYLVAVRRKASPNSFREEEEAIFSLTPLLVSILQLPT